MEDHDHDHDHDEELVVGFDDVLIAGDGFSSKLLFDVSDGGGGGGGFSYPAAAPRLGTFGDGGLGTFGDEMGSCEVSRNSTFGYEAVRLEPRAVAVAGEGGSERSGNGINKKKRNGSGQTDARVDSGDRTIKKTNEEGGSVLSVKRAKARRRQRLGEGIVTLQQLVCPYGKTDAASVLHEAMGYIRFLQEQVKVLCFPYLQCEHRSPECRPCDDGRIRPRDWSEGLRSKGLCLVPVEHIAHIAYSCNGADLWARSSTINTTMHS